jgi:hypothetical protein
MRAGALIKPAKSLIIITFIAVYACKPAPQQTSTDERVEKARNEARQVATELADSVRSLLFMELDKGGYENAVRVCSGAAQEIPRNFTARTGHYIRRVSLGYRNPVDVPDTYERGKLEEFDRLNRDSKLENEYFEVVREDGTEYARYMKPLVAGPMCITCHGAKEDIPERVREILAEKYPDDRATGYKAGDVRGAISVKIALAAKPGS